MDLAPDVALNHRRAPLLLGLFLGAVLIAVSAVLVLRVARPAPPPLPDLGTLPSFTLTDQDGHPSGLAELRDHVWIADFVFTRCPTVCPLLTAHMQQIARRTSGLQGFQLVSFTVDPAYDTPAVLTRYMQKHAIDKARWRFLTGPTTRIEEVVTRGFKEVLERDARQGPDDFLSIVHGGHLVLVDGAGHIRGYYDSNDPAAVEAVARDAAQLVGGRLRD